MEGRYQLVSFSTVGKDGSKGRGLGGDFVINFSGKKFVLTSGGKKPAQLTVAGLTAEVTLNGKLAGTYSVPDDQHVKLSPGKATASATLQAPSGEKRTITGDQLAGVIIPKGTAEATCGEDTLLLETDRVTLKLAR